MEKGRFAQLNIHVAVTAENHGFNLYPAHFISSVFGILDTFQVLLNQRELLVKYRLLNFLSWNGHFLVVIGGGREPQRSSLGSIVLDATTFPSSIGNRSMWISIMFLQFLYPEASSYASLPSYMYNIFQ